MQSVDRALICCWRSSRVGARPASPSLPLISASTSRPPFGCSVRWKNTNWSSRPTSEESTGSVSDLCAWRARCRAGSTSPVRDAKSANVSPPRSARRSMSRSCGRTTRSTWTRPADRPRSAPTTGSASSRRCTRPPAARSCWPSMSPDARRELLEAAGLARFTERTITSIEDLDHQLETIAHDGYVVSIEELEHGLNAVAAPIRDQGGAVIAALSVSGPGISAHRGQRPVRSHRMWSPRPAKSPTGWDIRADAVKRGPRLSGLRMSVSNRARRP